MKREKVKKHKNMKISVRNFSISFALTVIVFLLRVGFADAQNLVDTGDTSCEWGSRDCNKCAVNVEEQFRSLTFKPTGRFKYWSGAGLVLKGLDEPMLPLYAKAPNGITANKGHIQGFSRIPGVGDNTWFVASLDSSDRDRQPSGLVFSQMSSVLRDENLVLRLSVQGGDILSDVDDPDRYWRGRPAIDQSAKVYFPIYSPKGHNTKHPGGFQMIGRIAVVPSYGRTKFGGLVREKAFVSFVEIRESNDGLVHAHLTSETHLPKSNSNPITNHPTRAYALAITKLSNGRYLMMVNRSNGGHQQYLVSSNTSINKKTRWIENRVDDTAHPKYQNLSFVTDCESQQIYLIAVMYDKNNKMSGDNRADIYRLNLKGSGYDTGPRIAEVDLSEADDTCESKGGSSIYVTPEGRLVIYCSQGRSVEKNREDQHPSLLSFSEFATKQLPCRRRGILVAYDCRANDLFDRNILHADPNSGQTNPNHNQIGIGNNPINRGDGRIYRTIP